MPRNERQAAGRGDCGAPRLSDCRWDAAIARAAGVRVQTPATISWPADHVHASPHPIEPHGTGPGGTTGGTGHGAGGGGHGTGGGTGTVPTGSPPANTTVWSSITATQPVYEGTVIPRSFELTTANGRFWVSGNATEHLAEYAMGLGRNGMRPEMVELRVQAALTNLQTAVNAAAQQGIQYNTIIRINGWELRFAPPRQPGQLPAIIHALYIGG